MEKKQVKKELNLEAKIKVEKNRSPRMEEFKEMTLQDSLNQKIKSMEKLKEAQILQAKHILASKKTMKIKQPESSELARNVIFTSYRTHSNEDDFDEGVLEVVPGADGKGR